MSFSLEQDMFLFLIIQLLSSLKMLHLISLNIMDIAVDSISMTFLQRRCFGGEISGHNSSVSSPKEFASVEQIACLLKEVPVGPNKTKRETLPKDDTNVAIQQRQQEKRCYVWLHKRF